MCKIWFLTLWKNTGCGYLKTPCLREYLDLKIEAGEDFTIKSLKICTLYQTLSVSRKARWAGHVVCMRDDKFVHDFSWEA
jgi:hypothetical protein